MSAEEIERLIADLRTKLKEAGKRGDKEMADAYAKNLQTFLMMRDAKFVKAEETAKGIL